MILNSARQAFIDANGQMRWLMGVLYFLCTIPFLTGISVVFLGPAGMPGGQIVTASVDNEYRFLGTYWIFFGYIVYRVIPKIKSDGKAFYGLTGVIFFSGLVRAFSCLGAGLPHGSYLAAMALELIGIPSIVLWYFFLTKKRI